ncbi:uncharacterized protein TNCV_1410021 [Trichonephila clavipes]|nr:uncharacterized protein TNCV_1410021 [Trichonephila clavipes]
MESSLILNDHLKPVKCLNEYAVAHPVWWLATLTAVPLNLDSNPGEDMDVCKCTVPSWHRRTLNSRRAASPLLRLVEGGKGGRPLTTSRVLSLKIVVKLS